MLDDTFSLTAYAELNLRELIRSLPIRRVFLIEADEQRPAVVFQDLCSTRGIQVRWADDQAQVRLRPFCSGEDRGLAAVVLRALAAAHGTAITNAGEEVPDGELTNRLREVADALAARALDDFRGSLEAGDARPWILEGPARPFFLGPRVWAEVGRDANGELAARITERMLRVQYADRDASVSLAPRREVRPCDGEPLRVATIQPDLRWFIPSCELVGVTDLDGSEQLLPPAALAALLGTGCEALDERQLLMTAQRGERRDAFLRELRALAVEPAAFARGEVALDAVLASARAAAPRLALVEQGPAEPSAAPRAGPSSDRVAELERALRAGSLDPDGVAELELAYRDQARAAFQEERFEDELAALERRVSVVAATVRSCGVHPTRLAAAHAAVAGAEERCGRGDDAMHRLDLALRILAAAPADGSGVTTNHVLRVRLRRAELLARHDRKPEALAEVEQALDQVKSGASPENVAEAHLLRGRLGASLAMDRLSVVAALEAAVRALEPAISRGEALGLFVDVVLELEDHADDAGVLPLIAEAAAPALALLEAGRRPASNLLSLVTSRAKALWGSGDPARGLAELERGLGAIRDADLPLDVACQANYALADLLRTRGEPDRARAPIEAMIARALAGGGEDVVPLLRVNLLLTCLEGADVEGALEQRELILQAEGRARLGGLLFGSEALIDAGRGDEALAALEEAARLLGDEQTMRGEGLRAGLRLTRAQARLAGGDLVGARADAASAIATYEAHLARGIHLGELSCLEALVTLGAAGDDTSLARAVVDGERASDRLPRALDLANEAALWQAVRRGGEVLPHRLKRALARPGGAARLLLALERLASRCGEPAGLVLQHALGRLVQFRPVATQVAAARWRGLRSHLAGIEGGPVAALDEVFTSIVV